MTETMRTSAVEVDDEVLVESAVVFGVTVSFEGTACAPDNPETAQKSRPWIGARRS